MPNNTASNVTTLQFPAFNSVSTVPSRENVYVNTEELQQGFGPQALSCALRKAWSFILARYTGEYEVSFGVVTSLVPCLDLDDVACVYHVEKWSACRDLDIAVSKSTELAELSPHSPDEYNPKTGPGTCLLLDDQVGSKGAAGGSKHGNLEVGYSDLIFVIPRRSISSNRHLEL